MPFDIDKALDAPTAVQGTGGFDIDKALGVGQNTSTLQDLGTSVKIGVEQIPGIATGIMDIVPAVTLGARPFTRGAEALGRLTGFEPSKWSEEAQKEYSPKQQQAQADVAEAWDDPNVGIWDAAKEVLKRPAYMGNIVAEALPSTIAGGAIGRGLAIAGRVAAPVAAGAESIAPKALGFLERKLGEKLGISVAAGAGEGLTQAGSQMEQGKDNPDQRKNAIAAIGSGLIDAVIGTGSGQAAQALGLDTAETLIAKGFNRAVSDELKLGKAALAKTGKVLSGGAAEGIMQELPQSAQEQMWSNYAEGRPIWDNVARSAVEGAIAGFAMGAGANALPSRAQADVDTVHAKALGNVLPDAGGIAVSEGKATIVQGDYVYEVPVEELARHILQGGKLEDLTQYARTTEQAANRRAEEAQAARDAEEQAPYINFATQAEAVNRAKNLRGNTAQGVDPITGALLRDTSPGLTRNRQMDEALAQTPETPLPARTEQSVEPVDITAPTTITNEGKPFGSRTAAIGAVSAMAKEQGTTPEKLLPQYNIVPYDYGTPAKPGFVAVKKQEGSTNATQIDTLSPTQIIAQQEPANLNTDDTRGTAQGAPTTGEQAVVAPTAEDLNTTPNRALFSFAGKNAKNANGITTAKYLKNLGSTTEDIWKKTGWWEITPGRWSFELDDSLSDITATNGKLNTVLRQPAVFENYPELANIDVVFSDLGETRRGSFSSKKGVITINSKMSAAQQRSTLHHEVQHIIQGLEGFATGAQVRDTDSTKRDYWQKTGEVESRLVQARLNMTPAQRKATHPQKTLEAMLTKEGLLKEGQKTSDVLTSMQGASTGTTTAQVISEVKSFLGRGYDNLVRRGKLSVVQSVEQLPEGGPIRSASGNVAGVYDPTSGKVTLVADNIQKDDAKYVMTHEAGHALLREDKTFMDKREKILSDFGKLKSQAVMDAFAKVPEDTPAELRNEEALMYFIQEKKNHKHSLYKRVISTIKAALMRLGIPVTRLTESDLVQMFTQGTQAWARAEATAVVQEAENNPDILFSKVSDSLKDSKKNLATALGSLSNVKSKLHDQYVQHAPQWLAVTPMNTLMQTFGKKYQQIRDFGNGLNEIVHVKDSIVNNAAELYKEATELAKKGVGVDVFNKAAETSSFNQMTPWLKWDEQDWVPKTGTMAERQKATNSRWKNSGMEAATGKTFMEAYHESVESYKALGSRELKDAYEKIVTDLASVRRREMNNLLALIESVTEEGSDKRAEMMQRFEATFSNVKGAYWPLSRFGDFTLNYTDQEGFKWVKHFSTIAQRNAEKADLLTAGINPQTIKESTKSKQPSGAVQMPQEMLGQIETIVREKYLKGVDPDNTEAVGLAMSQAQDTIDDMTQAWLRWQPETSALKNSMRRKSIKGYNENMLRSYEDYMQRHASNIAWTEQGRKIDNAIKSLADEVKDKMTGDTAANTDMEVALLNDLRMRKHALRTVHTGPISSFIGKFGTAYYMTSPSIALVQMSQLGVVTMPKLAVMYGPAKTAKAMAKAFGKSLTPKYNKSAMFSDPVVDATLENIRAVVDMTNRDMPEAKGKDLGDELYSPAQKLAQINKLKPEQKEILVLREAMARNLLDVSAAYQAYERSRDKNPDSLGNKAFNLAMQPMVQSELASRKTAVLATYELATAQGKNFFESMNDVADVVNDTLYSYAKENKGWALQGGASRVLLQFMHYRIMTGLRLALLMKNSVKNESPEIQRAAQKEFIGIMGMSGALAGAVGIPMSSAVFTALNLVFGSDDEPYDSELEFANWLRETLGQDVADVVEKGPGMALGADISRRIGLGDIYGTQSSPPSNLHGKELMAWWAASLLGPSFSVASSWVQGYDQMINKGNYMRGLETAMPKPIRDVMKAFRVEGEGLKTGAGKKLLADDKINGDELLLMALGFNPDEVSRAQQNEFALSNLKTSISERRGRLIRDAVKGLIEGDTTDALEAIRAYNKRMPRYAIGGGDIKSAFRKQLKGEFGATGRRDIMVADQYGIPVYRGN